MIDKYIITLNCTIRDTLKKIDEAASKTVFVIDEDKKLIGVISDGDIRRAILSGIDLMCDINNIINRNPIYVDENYDINIVEDIFLEKKIEAIPVLDNEKHIIDVLLWNNILGDKKAEYKQIDLPAVIMAGGKGIRLDPFTRILPKALIPIGDKAMIEVIMDEYLKFGMKNFYISINHKGKMIKAYFEEHNGDYKIEFISEDKPLGTAGALKYLEGKIDTPFFVSNCDILIKEDYTKIYDFHRESFNVLTIVAAIQNHTVPYGVCEIDNGGILKNFIEKPEYNFLVNTGMYLLSPKVLRFIPKDELYHITQLFKILQNKNLKIGVYPVQKNAYIDVGQWTEYKNSLRKFDECVL